MKRHPEVWQALVDGLGDHGIYDSVARMRSECPDYQEADSDFEWTPTTARRQLVVLALDLSLAMGTPLPVALDALIHTPEHRDAAIRSSYPQSVMAHIGSCSERERRLFYAREVGTAYNLHRLLGRLAEPLPQRFRVATNSKRLCGPKPKTGYVKVRWDLMSSGSDEQTLLRVVTGPLGEAFDLLADVVTQEGIAETKVVRAIEVAPDSGELRDLAIDPDARSAGIKSLLERAIRRDLGTPARVPGIWCSRCWMQDTCADAPRIGREMRKPDPVISPSGEMQPG